VIALDKLREARRAMMQWRAKALARQRAVTARKEVQERAKKRRRLL